MSKVKMKSSENIQKLAICGVFAALAYVCVCVFRIKVQFLTLDIKDAVITVAAMLLGTGAGVVISLVVAFVEMVTLSDTMFYGFLMNFLSSATLSAVASLIYRRKRTLLFAVIGLVSAVFSVTAVMMAANILVTPHYMGVAADAVVKLIPKLLLPFNLTKAVLNSSIVMIIYKPVSDALRRVGFLKKRDSEQENVKYKLNKKTVAVTLCALALLIATLLIFFLVLKAKPQFGV